MAMLKNMQQQRYSIQYTWHKNMGILVFLKPATAFKNILGQLLWHTCMWSISFTPGVIWLPSVYIEHSFYSVPKLSMEVTGVARESI